MAKKTLQEVEDDDVIHKLAPIAEFIDLRMDHGPDWTEFDWSEMGLKEVWGVRDAKAQFSTLLTDASKGDMQIVTAGDGTPIVLISAKVLADAVSTLEDRRGLTLADAIAQLPYPRSALKSRTLHGHAPARGLINRVRVPEQA